MSQKARIGSNRDPIRLVYPPGATPGLSTIAPKLGNEAVYEWHDRCQVAFPVALARHTALLLFRVTGRMIPSRPGFLLYWVFTDVLWS